MEKRTTRMLQCFFAFTFHYFASIFVSATNSATILSQKDNLPLEGFSVVVGFSADVNISQSAENSATYGTVLGGECGQILRDNTGKKRILLHPTTNVLPPGAITRLDLSNCAQSANIPGEVGIRFDVSTIASPPVGQLSTYNDIVSPTWLNLPDPNDASKKYISVFQDALEGITYGQEDSAPTYVTPASCAFTLHFSESDQNFLFFEFKVSKLFFNYLLISEDCLNLNYINIFNLIHIHFDEILLFLYVIETHVFCFVSDFLCPKKSESSLVWLMINFHLKLNY